MNVIDAARITKRFRIPHEKKTTLFETALGYVKNQVTYEDFYALRDVSFTVKRGETTGLIGKNGSGKTTLLKILGGIIKPTEGAFHLEGVAAPLLSLNVGFHHELTAEENLFLYGAILGIPRKEIREKLREVLRFAGVERFKDTKLKNFSSGMTARLAFAMMVQTDPDILLLDEIFAVGDKDFIPQCISVFRDYKRRGKTILITSHDTKLIAEHCDKTMLLEDGNLIMFDETRKVIDYYMNGNGGPHSQL